MSCRFGYLLFAVFYATFITLTLVSIAQNNPIAAMGAATLTFLAGESMSRCRQP